MAESKKLNQICDNCKGRFDFEIRTHASALKVQCLNPLTMQPLTADVTSSTIKSLFVVKTPLSSYTGYSRPATSRYVK